MNRRFKTCLIAMLALSMSAGTALCQDHGGKDKDKDGDRQGERRRSMMARMMRDDGAPKVGEMAPTFTLKSLDGKDEMNLEGFRGKKPVVLFFGSYT